MSDWNGMIIRTTEDADRQIEIVRASAANTQQWLTAHNGDPLDLLRQMKFAPVGRHPVDGHPLNIIEQVNQTWTFLVAIAAARQLLQLHPETTGLRLAPGAHASQPLDIMSEEPDYVGAETFAAVHPRNNNKLASDMAKLKIRTENHRYIFFMSPIYPRSERLPQLEQNGIQVWSVAV